MIDEFNLSDKIWCEESPGSISVRNVREFIKKIKYKISNMIPTNSEAIFEMIDKLAGEELK